MNRRKMLTIALMPVVLSGLLFFLIQVTAVSGGSVGSHAIAPPGGALLRRVNETEPNDAIDTAHAIDVSQAADVSSGVLHVKPSASGDASCSDWDNACTLQAALGSAGVEDEIWVAAGVYTPTVPPGRAATFQVTSGVAVYGGFAGNETSRDQRDWGAHPTVLSGDIDGNDLTDPHGVVTTTAHISGSNSYHVVNGSGVDATAVLDGFTITGGDADGSVPHDRGGGMYNEAGNPTLDNITFSGNYAGQGGGMYNGGGSPTLTQITFSGNSAGRGGGMHNLFSSPTLKDVTFEHNNTAGYGGGMHNWDSDPMLVNVIFNGNSAGSGGGIENDYSDPTLVNVTFSGNRANGSGGGIFNNPGGPKLINVTFSGNTAGQYGGGIANGSANLSSCILWGNSAPDGDQIYDPYGDLTISYSLVGGGVYPGTGNISADPLFVRNPDPGDGDWTTPGDNDYGDLRLQLTSPASDAGDNTAVPTGVTTDLDGKPRLASNPWVPNTGVGIPPIVDMGAYEFQPGEPPAVIYVDVDATGANTGTSWGDALPELREALAEWVVQGVEIWVAEGVYKPTGGTERRATFHLHSGVAVYGGFAGNETSRDQRDWGAHPTLLSGDIDGNDLTDPHGVVTTTAHISGSNSYHVVTGSGVDATAVLDGFTITGGDADGDRVDVCGLACGGGMYNDGGSPTLANVIFSGNHASIGGGGMVDLFYGSPELTNVTFSGNSASIGGGIASGLSNPRLRNITFSGNSAGGGGGMFNEVSSPELTNVTFSGNSADYGGGMFNYESSTPPPPVANVTFSGNSATEGGGGMFNYDSSSPALTNVTFSGNSATEGGGGMYNIGTSATLTNCILWGNTDGGTDEQDAQIFNADSTITVSYSLVGGGVYTGTGNISADPLFVRNPDPGDGDWATRGDNDYGDLHLQLTSPAIDAGDNTAVPTGVTTDLDGNLRFVDIPSRPDTGVGPAPIVDMGAYEAQMNIYLPLVLRDH